MRRPREYNDRYGYGVQYLHRGMYPEALKAFQDANNVMPTSYSYSGIGRAHYGLGDYNRALANFEKACSLDSDNLQAYHWKAKTLCKLKRYDESKELFKTVLSKLNNGPDHFYKEVRADYEEMFGESVPTTQTGSYAGSYSQSSQQRTRSGTSSGRRPQEYDLAYSRGTMYLNSGNYEEALRAYREAQNILETSYSHSGMGRAYYGLGNFETALSHFETACVMDTWNLMAEHWRAKSLGKLRRYDESEEVFKTVLSRLSDGPEHFYKEVRADYEVMLDEKQSGLNLAPRSRSYAAMYNQNSPPTPRIIISGNQGPVNVGGIQANDNGVINRSSNQNTDWMNVFVQQTSATQKRCDHQKTVIPQFTARFTNTDSVQETDSAQAREQTEAKIVTNFCPQCGQKVDADDIFCRKCGTKLT